MVSLSARGFVIVTTMACFRAHRLFPTTCRGIGSGGTANADRASDGSVQPQRRSHGGVVALLVLLTLTLTVVSACAGEVPEVPVGPDGVPDAQLVVGRSIYSGQCARCHGSSGGGGTGPKLSDGRVTEKYTDIVEEIAVVAGGLNAMPSFAGGLSRYEIEAVVRYTREVLD